ncbi:hypothetical protein [Dactylosporangium matsuzakiense]|uniref:Uncharacterized protein n=1 Tax=Dactylosporangium matsuzakiense TaxID=53360 RepID=A0A9W6KKU6_9ACTN|nr:hypothetical protein [Dactylosporangium matsuzakiense]GLL02827.1 hypothetical protein GCM10017581_045690 [Dactylosporangium matsuzakiense]
MADDAAIAGTNHTSFGHPAVLAPAPPAAPAAGAEYALLVRDLLETAERHDRSLGVRALAVVTVSAVLLMSQVGWAFLVRGSNSPDVSAIAVVLAVLAVVFLLAAAAVAAQTGAAWRTRTLDPATLPDEIWARWGHPGDDPIAKTTATRLALWAAAHEVGQRRARYLHTAIRLLVTALVAEVLAVLLAG